MNYRVYTWERKLCGVCGLAFQSREKKCGLFLWSSDRLIDISFEIDFILENWWFIGGSGFTYICPPNHNLEVKAFTQRFRCVIWEMRYWKTPPDHHLNCAIQITLRDCVHIGQNTVIRMTVTRRIILFACIFALMRKHSLSPLETTWVSSLPCIIILSFNGTHFHWHSKPTYISWKNALIIFPMMSCQGWHRKAFLY